jgi:hypothetical protein
MSTSPPAALPDADVSRDKPQGLAFLARIKTIAMRLAALAAWALLAIALWQRFVSLSHYYVTRVSELWFFFSSDTLGFALMYTDLFRDGFHWSGWNVAHAPEYAEMAWYFLLSALSGGPLRGHVLSAALQVVLLALGLRLLYRSLGAASTRAASVLAPLLASVIVVLINIQRALDFGYFMVTLRHASTVIVEVFCLACFVRVVTRPTHAAWAGLLFLTGLGAASDALFLSSFTVPALGVLFAMLLLRQCPARRALWPLLAMLGATAVGQLAFRCVTSLVTVDYKLKVVPSTAIESLNVLARDVFTGRPRLAHACVLLAWWAASLLILSLRMRPRRAPDALTLAAVFGLFMTLTHGAAVVLTSKPLDELGYTRYLLPIYVFAFAGTALVVWNGVTYLMRGSASATSWVAVGLVALSLSHPRSGVSLPPQGAVVFDYYSPLVRCFDDVARKYDLRYGIADYALAKFTTVISRQGLRVYPVTWRGDPALFFGNAEWFLGGVGARYYDDPHYTFAILGSVSPDRGGLSREIVAEWGWPVRATEVCYGYNVVIFGDGADGEIRKHFRSNRWLRAYYARHGYALP